MGMIRRALVLSLGVGLVASASCTDTRSQPPRTSETAVSPHPTNSSASPTPMSPDLDPKDVVLAFGRDGDIWLAMANGEVVNATKSTRKERNPTISYDGETVVFERGRNLVYLRLSDGSTKAFADGSWPTFGPRGYLAWTNEEGEIVVGSPFSTATTSHPATKEGGAWVEHLAWDQSVELLYYEAVIGEGAVPYAMDVVRLEGWRCSSCGGGIDLVAPRPIYPDNSREGSEYLTTALGSDVGVVRVCCRRSEAGGWQEAEIGGIEYFDWGTRYHRLRHLEDLALNLSGSPLLLRDAGRLRAEVRSGEVVRWTTTNDTAWLVGDGAHLWLVRWHGDATKLPFKVDGGAAASPRYSKSLFVRRNWNL